MEKELKNKFLLITYIFVLGLLLINYEWLVGLGSKVVSVASPFLIGAGVAFILNVIVNMLEGKLLKKLDAGKRGLSIVLSLLIVIGFIIVLLFILIPQVKNAGMIFVENLPKYHDTIFEIGEKFGLSENQLDFLNIDVSEMVDGFKTFVSNNTKNLISFSFGFASTVVGALTNFFIGLVFAIYILVEKESLAKQFKKLFNRVLPKKKYERLLEILDLSNKTFTSFIKVQFVEACILGVLCFIGMILLGLPYAATISVVIGFTALIPMFGAFIGCVIGAFLIFMVSPLQSLVFIAYFLILQQIEGNFIYPKVVGGKIGLPSIWVLVAVTAGGSIGGVIGMLLSVPVVSVIYALVKEYVNTKKTLKETVKETIDSL